MTRNGRTRFLLLLLILCHFLSPFIVAAHSGPQQPQRRDGARSLALLHPVEVEGLFVVARGGEADLGRQRRPNLSKFQRLNFESSNLTLNVETHHFSFVWLGHNQLFC